MQQGIYFIVIMFQKVIMMYKDIRTVQFVMEPVLHAISSICPACISFLESFLRLLQAFFLNTHVFRNATRRKKDLQDNICLVISRATPNFTL